MSKKQSIKKKKNKEVLIFSQLEVSDRVVRGSHFGRVSIDKLQKQATEFYNSLSEIFSKLSDVKGDFSLEEITVEAELSADGKIGFLGSGTEVGVKGSISFKLVKNQKR